MKLLGFEIEFTRQSKFLADLGGYTAEVRRRAIKSSIQRVLYDGTPTVMDPMGVIRGVTYYVWFRPFGWLLAVKKHRLNAASALAAFIRKQGV